MGGGNDSSLIGCERGGKDYGKSPKTWNICGGEDSHSLAVREVERVTKSNGFYEVINVGFQAKNPVYQESSLSGEKF